MRKSEKVWLMALALLLIAGLIWWLHKGPTIPLPAGADVIEDTVLGTEVVVSPATDVIEGETNGLVYYSVGQDILWAYRPPRSPRYFAQILNPESPGLVNQGVFGWDGGRHYFGYPRTPSEDDVHVLHEFQIEGLGELDTGEKVWLMSFSDSRRDVGYMANGLFIPLNYRGNIQPIQPTEYFAWKSQ